MKVLSIDWDYFFPDTIQFDWAHREAPFFMEDLWALRVSNKSILTHKYALDVMQPDKKLLKNFWVKVCPKEPCYLGITESHLDLFHILKGWKDVEIYNFDAHHDLYYGTLPKKPECGSWAGHALQKKIVSRYTIIYPPWRENFSGLSPFDWGEKVIEMFEIPDRLPEFDVVFICRSSAWTPSWSDDKWLKFINYWQKFSIWEFKSSIPYVLKLRSPDLDEAKKLQEESIVMLSKLRDKIRS